MDLRSGLAVVVAAVLALAAWTWFVARPSDVSPTARTPERSAPVAQAELSDPEVTVAAREGLTSPAPAQATVRDEGIERGLHVRSTSGLALPDVEWRAPGGEWRRVELSDDGAALAPVPAPCEVRARGHVAAALGPDRRELQLEPDVLFRVQAADLRACLREIDVHDPFLLPSQVGTEADTRRPRVGVWGFVTDEEWAVAVSAAAVERELRRPELRVVMYRRDGRRTDVALNATSGLRASWEVPCDETIPTAPLRVTVVRPDGLEGGALDVGVSRTEAAPHDSRQEDHAWGTVHHYPAGFWIPQLVLAADENELEFEAVPLHVPLALLVQDPTRKAFASEFFLHDGSPRRVTLRPPLRVRGRLLDARDDTPLERAALVWECREGGQRILPWRAEAQDAGLAPDGSFELAGPMSPPWGPELPLDPPGTLWVRIEAPGFDPLELEREVGVLRTIDLGDLRLDARTPELVLAPGHGLTPEQVAWHGFQIAGQPERFWEVRWGRLADDGSLELHFGEEELASPDTAPDWSAARALILNVNDQQAPVRAFERDDRGRWVAIEMRRHTLELRVEPSASERNWWVGWEWNGLFALCASFSRPEAGETLHVELSAPVDGARLGWASREPGRRGWLQPDEIVPLSGADGVLVLR